MKAGWQQLIGLLVGGILLVGAGFGLASLRQTSQPAPIQITPPQPTATPSPTAEPPPLPTASPMRVYVSGAVRNPAVYSLPAGSIIDDAIRAAGGFTADADPIAVNLAQSVVDGMQIYVPLMGEAEPPPVLVVPAETNPPADANRLGAINLQGLININRATQRDLEMLPGIGPATAEKIIAHREANGPFATIEDVMDVTGIGEAKFAAIKDLITVGP